MKFFETASRNFRNLKTGRYFWGEGLNMITGPNGSGKTNLLESLSVLSGWGPFGGNRIASVISWTADEPALLSASLGGERDVEVEVSLTSKTSMKAGGERVRHAELRSLVPSLAFLPSDINLIDGSASVRRLFLDKLCSLWTPVYARRLSEYRQLVRHRCALLKQGKSAGVTTTPLVHLGGWVQDCRRHLVDLLAGSFNFGGDVLSLPITFSLNPSIPQEVPSSRYLAAALAATAERERYACRPLVGPHRDDLLVLCDGRPAALALSRGQKRRLVLRLILAAGRVIENRTRLKPVLLFDDLTAELDEEGRRSAFQALTETGWQIFVTGVENPFPDRQGIRQHSLENVN